MSMDIFRDLRRLLSARAGSILHRRSWKLLAGALAVAFESVAGYRFGTFTSLRDRNARD
jgi:hypothetical protein